MKYKLKFKTQDRGWIASGYTASLREAHRMVDYYMMAMNYTAFRIRDERGVLLAQGTRQEAK